MDFACETARRSVVETASLRLSLLESGTADRPPVCFLHGGGAHAHWFDLVTPRLASFHVLSLDQRGHGESDWAVPAAYATEDFAADLLALMEQRGFGTISLVGHSMGGHNAMAFAAWHPGRVRALVIVDSRPAIPPERLGRMQERGRRPPRRHPTLEDAVATFRLLPVETVAEPALLDHLARRSFSHREGAFSLRFDPACYEARRPVDAWPLLERITAPTLVVRGALSPILTRAMADRMVGIIPNARLIEVPDAYHHLILDRPHDVASHLESFLM